jgi:hypothetical protein
MTPSPIGARLTTAAMLALALAAVSHPAQSATQLFKCVIDKRTVYQQQACPANAEPSPGAASAPPSAPSAHGANAPASAPAHPLKPASRAASSVTAKPR